MSDHDVRSDIRSLRYIVERIDRDLAAHLSNENDRDMRSAENNGRLQGRLDRIEASLANLGTLIKRLEAKIGRSAGAVED
ncbi:hypothetical protein [Candidatus Poriferisodalis sp.]|uniref:hypothetical protein n=1 Tax=Candidatus Poriferisodalis sp. TaxID=3101277 RepID=UPI003B019445